MGAEVDQVMIGEMVDAIVQAVAPERIYLFGSHARNAAVEGSDIDLMVVEDSFDVPTARRGELKRIRAALARFRVPKDIILCSLQEESQWRSSLNHVIGICQREGVLLYERP